jgi:hypothetical protein
MSHWPTKLNGRSNPTREVVSPTSSTSPDGDHTRIPWIGKFPFQNPYYEKFGNFGTQRLISIRELNLNLI